MILEFGLRILGTILFFLPGILLSYIIFPRTDIIKRSVFSIILAVSIGTLIGVSFFVFNLVISYWVLIWALMSLVFWVILMNKGDVYETIHTKDIRYILLFTIIGTIWRVVFMYMKSNHGDAYFYSGQFSGTAVPDLGFYTGMARDHSNYIGTDALGRIYQGLCLDSSILNVFLITFVFLGLIYLIFKEYRNKKMAYLGVALMSLGPIEIFHTTLGIIGHPLSYIALFLLFLLFKTKDNNVFWIALLLCSAMMFTYYTASMVIIITCVGFIISLFLKELFFKKNIAKAVVSFFTSKKFYAFLIILVVVGSYLFIFSNMLNFTVKKPKDMSNVKDTFVDLKQTIIFKNITMDLNISEENISEEERAKLRANEEQSTLYRDPTLFGLSAIRWQALFFMLCGLSFVVYMFVRRDFSETNVDLLLCLIPVAILCYGFLQVHMPARAFDYIAFFGLLVLMIPKKYFKMFFILSFVFILVSGIFVAADKQIFFDIPDGEVEGAIWINNTLDGRVFSDQSFINPLIKSGYYNVTGADDIDPVVYNLFYQKRNISFFAAIEHLDNNLDVNYIVLTKRMREKYILMLNYPQKAVVNVELYEKYLNKVYDNGDVRVYSIRNETFGGK